MTRISYIVLIFSLLSFSCSEIIDINLSQGINNRLVVEGSITTEFKIHQVKLSRTADYFYDKPAPPELEAKVSISDGDTVMQLTDKESKGIYTTEDSCAGIVGHNYTLNIQLSNGEQFTSSESIKSIIPIDSIKYEYTNAPFPGMDDDHFYNINIFAKEDPAPGNYYQWELFVNDKQLSDTLRLKTFVSDDMVNGSYIGNWTVYSIPEYKINQDTNEVRLQMLSISEEKYNFYNASLLETDYSGGGFNGPPANIPTNISNGALGFFSASAVIETKIRLIKVKN